MKDCNGQCLNGGSCDELKGICQCPNNIVGDFCEILLENNQDKPETNCGGNCSEHGVCINNTFCFCDVRFEGIYCEHQILDIEVIRCRSKCYKKCLNSQDGQLQCIEQCLEKNCSMRSGAEKKKGPLKGALKNKYFID